MAFLASSFQSEPIPGSNHEIRQGIRLLARLTRVAERACLETGISLPQYRLLLTLSEAPLRAGELAERVGVSRPTLTSLIDGLERNHLLKRCPVPQDRRGVRLEPTAEGLRALDLAERSLGERLSTLVETDPSQSVGQLVTTLSAALDRSRN